MNYEQMSDFEINKSVAELLSVNLGVGSIESGCVVWDESFNEIDYCNNPSDAWPIITENHIHICFGSELTTAKAFTCTELVEVVDKNPLRAAMICFLKMKDAEK